MIGAIIGDIIGSPYEGSRHASVDGKDFPLFEKKSRFTDDTVLTCATADAILHRVDNRPSFSIRYKEWARKYPKRGYGSGFQKWVDSPLYFINNSFANGSMMRCSPIGFFYKNLRVANRRALDSIQMTHNSPESARGVQSIVSAINMALKGNTKAEIKEYVEEQFGHMLNSTVEEQRTLPKTTIRCNTTAVQALICFMESTDYESAIRNAIYTKGDTDTIAAIAGSIAEAFYGVQSIPHAMIVEAKKRLSVEMILLINEFYSAIGKKDFQI